jgi:hypothetical protein
VSVHAALRRKHREDSISLKDWLEVVRSDPELELQENGTDATFVDPSEPDDPRGFFWSERDIYTKSPTEASLEKLCDIADKLGSCVVEVDGEDGIYYTSKAPERARKAPRPPRAYSPKQTYEEGDGIDHPKFGRGTIVGIAGKQFVVRFESGEKKLAHGLS